MQLFGNRRFEAFGVPIAAAVGPVEAASVASGEDVRTVEGDATWHFHDKITLMTGTVNRVWEGPITRCAGMEGVICGGAFAKTFVGSSMTVPGLTSGDVYGGCARASGSRVYIAGYGYRSAESAAWAMGFYMLGAASTIVPAADSPSQKTDMWSIRTGSPGFSALMP